MGRLDRDRRQSFRTAGSPLRAESGYVQVTAKAGDLITATTDQDGVVVSAERARLGQ